jgi:sulfatase maturation enzyme AslB (radical SAM superfamily)
VNCSLDFVIERLGNGPTAPPGPSAALPGYPARVSTSGPPHANLGPDIGSRPEGGAVAHPGARGVPGFHLLAKPTGAVCNLDCSYCFYLSKEMLYSGSRFRMGDDLLEAYIRQLIEAHAGAPEVTVAWQGGEPTLMGLGFFGRCLDLQRAYARPGQRVVNTIQTNGTLIDDSWARFFKENDFLVGLSIDGPPELHDAFRVDKGGKPTFDRVIAGLAHLRRHDVAWNAEVVPKFVELRWRPMLIRLR